MSKKAEQLKASFAGLEALAEDFQTPARRELPTVPPPSEAGAGAPTPTSVKRARPPAKDVRPGERRKPGRPRKEGARMVPFSTRLSEPDRDGLDELAHQTGKSETALVGEAMSLLFKHYLNK